MPKIPPPKTRCGNEWTEARFKNFIISLIRQRTMRWRPKQACIERMFIKDGVNPKTGRKCKLHLCTECDKLHSKGDMRADHIIPVVDPDVGFVDWNTYIERMFVEEEHFKAICVDCHKLKTAEERELRKASK